MGAITLANVQQLGHSEWELGKRMVLAKVTMSASYATGGDTVPNITKLGLKRVTGLFTVAYDVSGTGNQTYGVILGTSTASPVRAYSSVLAGTQAVPKIKLNKGGTVPVEETVATDVSTHIFWGIFVGESGP